MLKHYSENNFNEIIKNKVLVDFYANWCGPCKMLSPILEELANEVDIDIIKVDVDEYSNLAREYKIMSIPCLILFDNEKEIKRTLGFMPKEKLKEFVNNKKKI